LADKNEVVRTLAEQKLYPYVLYSCKSSIGRNNLRTMLKIMVKREKFAEKHRKAHVGVIGYPNTGKSSLINTLASGGRAAAASEAGFTKGIHKIRFNKDILILDTPGVFGEKENVESSSKDLMHQAEIGVRNASSVKNPEFIVHELMQGNPGLFELFYGIKAEGDSEVLLETLGRKKGFIKKGNKADSDKTARYILKDWQTGKIRKK
jgi:ribosome biogenesis GTPase A